MKKAVAVLATLALGYGLVTAPARGDDTPHLEFVRALRARNYNEEAYDYLTLLPKKGAPKDVLAFIPLEKAACKVAQATQEPDSGRRSSLFKAAVAELDAVKDGPFAAIAQLEKARITIFQGRALMAKARQYKKDDAADQKNVMTKVHDLFRDQVEDELNKAKTALDNQAKLNHPKAVEEALKQARMQLEMEMAVNQIDQAMTYEVLNKDFNVRGKMIDRAVKELGDLYEKDSKGSIGLQARAWKAKAHAEISGAEDAKKEIAAVLAVSPEAPYAEPARRLARTIHFLMPVVHPEDAKIGPNEARRLGDEWLRDYPAFANTFEGNYVRYELAKLYMAKGQEALGGKENPSKAQLDKARPDLEKAVALFTDVASSQNEFTPNAEEYKFEILGLLSEHVIITREAIEKAKNFDELMRMVESMKLQLVKEQQSINALKRQPNKTEAEQKKLEQKEKDFPEFRKAQFHRVEFALARALEIADAKVKPDQLATARADLIWVTMANGDPYRAAVLGEYMARQAAEKKGGPEAVKAAAYALEAYASIIGEDMANSVDKVYLDADRARFKALAELLEKNWPDAPETNAARHQVGTQLFNEEKYAEAEKKLATVSDSYNPGALTDARYWWAEAARKMLADPNLGDDKKNYYKAQMVKAIKGVPDTLPADVHPQIAQAFVLSKLQYCGILYEEKKYPELRKFAAALKDKINKFSLDDKVKDSCLKQADLLTYYASFGEANADLHAGKYKEAISVAGKIKDTIKKDLDKVREPEKKWRAEYEKNLNTIIGLGYDAEKPEEFLKLQETFTDNQKKTLAQAQEKMKEAADNLNEALKESSRYTELYRGLIMMQVRAEVLGENPAGARRAFQELRTDAKFDGNTQVYVTMVAQIRKQIEDLKKEKGKEKEVKILQDGFRKLLDALANDKTSDEFDPAKMYQRPERKPGDKEDPPNPRPGLVFFLIESYSGLDQHEDAVKILAQIPPPPKTAGIKPEEKAKNDGLYHYAQMRYLKELRLAKKFDDARKLLETIQKQDWGKGIEPKKENAYLWHDQEKYGAAAAAWAGIIKDFGQKPDFTKAQVKEQYFDAFWHFLDCKYKFAKNNADPRTRTEIKENKITAAQKKEALTKEVAKAIVDMEANPNVTDQFKTNIADLLKKEDVLRKEYDTAKKEKTNTAAK